MCILLYVGTAQKVVKSANSIPSIAVRFKYYTVAPAFVGFAVFSRKQIHQQVLLTAAYVREITSFPGSKYADQVDSTSQALKFLGEDMLGQPEHRGTVL
jgi:hypothetical protein